MSNENVERNEALANDLKDFIMNNNLSCDVRIYFNNKCYDWCDVKAYFKEPNVLEGIIASKYFEYADNDTVSMTFEGDLYDILNYAETKSDRELANEFYNVFQKHNCYYELGNSWNLAVCYL